MSKLLALWGDKYQALASKLSIFSPGSGGNASKEAILKLVGKDFQEIRVQWLLPPHDLFLRSLQWVPVPHIPEFTTYDHVTCK